MGESGYGSGLLIWVLCLLSGWVMSGQGGDWSDLALKAQGGVLCACDAWWRLVGSLWRFCGRVLKSAADGRRCMYYFPAACCLLPADDL